MRGSGHAGHSIMFSRHGAAVHVNPFPTHETPPPSPRRRGFGRGSRLSCFGSDSRYRAFSAAARDAVDLAPLYTRPRRERNGQVGGSLRRLLPVRLRRGGQEKTPPPPPIRLEG